LAAENNKTRSWSDEKYIARPPQSIDHSKTKKYKHGAQFK